MIPAIAVEHLHYRYPDGTPGLTDVTWTVAPGQRWGLVGANGCGKSTLLRHIAGLHACEDHLRIEGRPATRSALPWIRSRVGLVFQNPEHQLFLPTLREDVAFGPLNLGLGAEETARRVDATLAQLGLTALADRPPHHLSGGEKRAAALATVLALEPAILLLDEPTNDLDPAGRRQVIHFLRRWPHTLVVATHDLELILEVATDLAILDRGTLAVTGAPATLLADAALLERHRLEVPPSLCR